MDAPRAREARRRRRLPALTFRRRGSARMTTLSNCSTSTRAVVKLSGIDTSSGCEANGSEYALRRRSHLHPIVITTPCFNQHTCQAPRRRSACVAWLIMVALVAAALARSRRLDTVITASACDPACDAF